MNLFCFLGDEHSMSLYSLLLFNQGKMGRVFAAGHLRKRRLYFLGDCFDYWTGPTDENLELGVQWTISIGQEMQRTG